MEGEVRPTEEEVQAAKETQAEPGPASVLLRTTEPLPSDPLGHLLGPVDASAFRRSGLFSDAVLVASDGTVRAHRLVLGAACPVFRDALEDTAEAEDSQGISTVLLPDFCLEQLRVMLGVMYGDVRSGEEEEEVVISAKRAIVDLCGGTKRHKRVKVQEPVLPPKRRRSKYSSGEGLASGSPERLDSLSGYDSDYGRKKKRRGKRGPGRPRKRRPSDEVSISSDSNTDSDADWKPRPNKVKAESQEAKNSSEEEEEDPDFDVGDDENDVHVKEEAPVSFEITSLVCPADGCGHSADSEESLVDHMSSQHSISSCQHCKLFFFASAMEAHVIREHSSPEEIVYFVNGVERRRRKRRGMSEIKRDPDNPDLLLCPYAGCDFSDEVRRVLHNHINKVHRKISCQHCGKQVQSQKLAEHVARVHTGEKTLSCDQCGDMFYAAHELKKHQAREGHLPEGDDSTVCKHCGILFKSRARFRNHEAKCRAKKAGLEHKPRSKDPAAEHFVPHPTDPQQCSQCEYRHEKPAMMKKHYREYHYKPLCPHCGRPYSYYFLDRHIRTVHTKELQFQCEICSVRFYGERQLKHHIDEAHVKELKYVCDVCGQSFFSQGLLTRHKTKKHNINRFFPCNLCSKTYLNNFSLKKHRIRHHPGHPAHQHKPSNSGRKPKDLKTREDHGDRDGGPLELLDPQTGSIERIGGPKERHESGQPEEEAEVQQPREPITPVTPVAGPVTPQAVPMPAMPMPTNPMAGPMAAAAAGMPTPEMLHHMQQHAAAGANFAPFLQHQLLSNAGYLKQEYPHQPS